MAFVPERLPGKSYRGVNLWFLNDRLEDEVLVEQLNSLHEAGCGAVIARTFDGLRTEYLSPEFHARMRTIVDHAERLGMKVYLQAGYMPGGIPEMKPEHRACVLAAVRADERPEPDDQILLQDDAYTYVRRSKNNYIQLLDREAVASYLRQAYQEAWGDLQDRFGTGIFSVWVDEPEFFPDQLPWSDELLDRFEQQWGYRLERCIPDLFRRSATSYRTRHHYRRIQLAMFIEAYFAQVSRWCEERGLQFSGHLMGEDRLDSQIGFTVAAMPMYRYMQLPGIDHLTGNLKWTALDRSGSLSIPFILTPKQCSSIAHQDGKKTVLSEMYGVSSQSLTFQDQKRIAEYLAVLGINHRCLHASFYSMRGRRKRIYVPHLSEQQPWWRAYRDISDYFARLSYALHQGTYAAEALIVHSIESAYGLYEPLDFPKRPTPDVYEMNEQLTKLSVNLMAAQIGFDYGDEHVMEQQAYVDERGRIVIGQMAYATVILPQLLTIRASTLRLLEQFVRQGGLLIATSAFPELVDCEASDALRRLEERAIRIDNSPQALREAVGRKPDARAVRVDADRALESIWVHERHVGRERLVYILNTHDADEIAIELQTGAAYRSARQYDLNTGEMIPLPNLGAAESGVRVRFDLAPWASKVLVLSEEDAETDRAASRAAADSRQGASDAASESIVLSAEAGQLTMERADPNAFTLDYCRYRKSEAEPYSDPLPVIAVQEILSEANYEGDVTLCYEFHADEIPSFIAAAIEDAAACRIRVNGTPVQYEGLPHYVDRAFQPIEITSWVLPGANRLELTREFMPLKKAGSFHLKRFQNAPGVELESIYLIGEFAVRGSLSERAGRPRCARFAPAFAIGKESRAGGASWPRAGYPFYVGKMIYHAEVTLDPAAPHERIELALNGLEACLAEVIVNGQAVSKLAWKPFAADITQWVAPGRNRIEIHVTNTLRNLLGPHHHPKGEMDYSYGEESYSGRKSPETGEHFPGWHAPAAADTSAWTHDYFFVDYGLQNIVMTRISNHESGKGENGRC